MPTTLFGRLTLALVVLLGVTSVAYVGLTIVATRSHTAEISQSLNHSLAANIVASKVLMQEGQVNAESLHQVFDMLMAINPAIEVYLLGPTGQILAYSSPPHRVKRKRVSLGPIEAFLTGRARLPIHGDDPRDPQGHKVFSAAPIRHGEALQGYLYVVLGGETYDSVAAMFERSHVLRLTIGAVTLSLLLLGTAGAFYFHRLTRRLRDLAALMNELRSSNFEHPVALRQGQAKTSGDEIDRLGRIFEEMARRIVDQINELKEADRTRRELFADVSHDLRTPLAALHGAIETLWMKAATLPEAERQRYLSLALSQSEHLGGLIQELFELATLESGDRTLRHESFSIAELVQDVVQRFRTEADRRKLTIDCDVPSDAPAITADIGLIERVFENLIENAMRCTPEGGHIKISVAPNRDGLAVQVADTGCGIPTSELPRIFDRRYRTQRDRDDRTSGTGLGLAIAQQILRLHGSSMSVDSAVGAGTTFRFRLPKGA